MDSIEVFFIEVNFTEVSFAEVSFTEIVFAGVGSDISLFDSAAFNF